MRSDPALNHAKSMNRLALDSPYESAESESDDDVGEAENHTSAVPRNTDRPLLGFKDAISYGADTIERDIRVGVLLRRSSLYPLHLWQVIPGYSMADNDFAIPPLTPNRVHRIQARPATRPDIRSEIGTCFRACVTEAREQPISTFFSTLCGTLICGGYCGTIRSYSLCHKREMEKKYRSKVQKYGDDWQP
jgi:hypothetical protein